MIVNDSEITQYLDDFKNGRITKGKGMGIGAIDDYIRFKSGTFNMILGHDNVGKTYYKTWHQLVLSVKYGYKWCIWTGENKAGQIVRDLIQFLTGKYIKYLTLQEIQHAQGQIAEWFDFVDNSKTYKYLDLLNIFDKKDYTGCLIDPYTGLDRKFGHSDNYEFLNLTRQWVNQTNKTIDVCTHPSSASGRAQGIHPKGTDYEGYLKEPYKADTEGGKPFANRCDDFLIVHRMPDHPTMNQYTMLFIDKVKDTETGGKRTMKGEPVLLEFNNGLGFKVNNINPIFEGEVKGDPDKFIAPSKIKLNDNFENETNITNSELEF
jgi:hypothetical protein